MQIRRLHRQFEATLEGRVAERTRIARELHDTLLQHFHGLLLQFQAGVNLLPDRPRESKQVLTGAIDRAAAAITEGRDTVHGLRTAAPVTDGVAEPLRALAQQLANDNGNAPSAQVQEHGTPQSLHPLVHDETLRIAGEALRNAFRHADAMQVEVEIHFEPRAFLVRVRDDGKGIPPEVMREGQKEGHFGLTGMRERAKLVGGRLVVRSSADSGTEVELSVPASRAYGRSSPARSWPWKKLAPSEIGHQ
jgi:signal transduction histidine kinase